MMMMMMMLTQGHPRGIRTPDSGATPVGFEPLRPPPSSPPPKKRLILSHKPPPPPPPPFFDSINNLPQLGPPYLLKQRELQLGQPSFRNYFSAVEFAFLVLLLCVVFSPVFLYCVVCISSVILCVVFLSGAFWRRSFLLCFTHGGVLSLGMPVFSVSTCFLSGVFVVVLVIFLCNIFSMVLLCGGVARSVVVAVMKHTCVQDTC